MPSYEGIRELKSWQQYTFTRNALRSDTVYAILFHADGCSDCVKVVPKWRRAIEIDGKIPTPIEYYVGGMAEMGDKEHPHPVRGELERLVGRVCMPTLVIMTREKVLGIYGDDELTDLTAEGINGLLRQGMDYADAEGVKLGAYRP